MEIITVVEGNVPSDKAAEFESRYAAVDQEPLPPGLLRSSLLRDSQNPARYRIQTVWASRQAIEEMRRHRTPKALELFHSVSVEPTLSLFEVVHRISPSA